ncbi:unnamed protein product [Malus baccata var. baccata]
MAGSSSSGEIRTPIFSGVNYDFWRTKLRTIFVSHDLWSMIEDGYVVPLSTVALTEAQTKELKENIKRDAKALGVIQNAISEEIFPRISLKVYRGSTKVRVVKLQSLRRDFEYIRMKDDELLNDYLSRLSEIINQMKSYGETLSDERIVQKYLISLPRNKCWFKGKVKCHKCSKFGHMQKECTYNYNQLAHYSKAKGEETNMFCVGHDTTVQAEAKVWFVDNGCSNHMTVNKNILHNIDTTNPTQVKMGNGQLVDILGRGTIAVHTKNGKMFIKDVMLVHDLKQNLLSLGQLIEYDYYLYFGDNICNIYDGRNREQLLAKIEMRKSRSFPLTIKYATQIALKMEVQEDSKI